MSEHASPSGPESEVFGLLAEFENPGALYRACEKVRDAGYSHWDAHCPFPVHGLDRAMGLKASLVPWFVLVLGLGGAAAGMALQWWTSTEGYALVISGKPFFSWPAFVPIMFECGVLGGAVGAILGFLTQARLPMMHHGLFHSERFERVTDDGFFISIEAGDEHYDEAATAAFLRQIGARHVETVAG